MSNLICLFEHHRYMWYSETEKLNLFFFTIKYQRKVLRCIQCNRIEYPILKANIWPEGEIIGTDD